MAQESTSNERLRDALLRRQIALAKFERGLQTDIIALLDDTEKDLRAQLADRVSALEGSDFGKTVNSRLVVLENSIRKIRGAAFDETADMWDKAMQDLAVAEADYIDATIKDVSPVQLDTTLPDPVQLAAIVSVQPMEGRLLSDWASDMEDVDVQRIMDAVNIGMAQGSTTDEIIQNIMGTKAFDGADGVLNMTRNGIAAITQTAVATIANEARGAYFDANSDIISEVQWVATLDADTCAECGDLDGETWPVGEETDTPPAHINCRCTLVPVIDGAAIGDRPANAATEDQLDGLSPDERTDMVKELVGQVPSTINYEDWLGTQTEAFQDAALGPTRAALFRDGNLPLSRFVNSNGETYTLDQLRQLEPDAFKAAGL